MRLPSTATNHHRQQRAHARARARARQSPVPFGALLALALATACGEPPPPATPPPADEPAIVGPFESLDARPCPDDSVLTWESVGEPFMRSWCTGCHSSELPLARRAGAPTNVNFNSLGDVKAQAERVWARAADQNNTMPPGGVPPELERAQLGEWIACGMKTRAELHGAE